MSMGQASVPMFFTGSRCCPMQQNRLKKGHDNIMITVTVEWGIDSLLSSYWSITSTWKVILTRATGHVICSNKHVHAYR